MALLYAPGGVRVAWDIWFRDRAAETSAGKKIGRLWLSAAGSRYVDMPRAVKEALPLA